MLFDGNAYKRAAKKVLATSRKPLMIATAVMIFLSLLVGFGLGWGSIMVTNNTLVSQILVAAVIGIIFFAYVSFCIDAYNASITGLRIVWTGFIDRFDRFVTGFLSNLWFMLWITLWSCLFFIPGIVKAFAYSQMFFILAENPSVSVRKAMRMSIAMTNGFKGDLFCLYLSFIGWALLGCITFGIAYIWIQPYVMLTQHQAYLALRKNAIDRNILSLDDFGMQPSVENSIEDSTSEVSSTVDFVADNAAAADQPVSPAEESDAGVTFDTDSSKESFDNE